jgi:hypothetical protein
MSIMRTGLLLIAALGIAAAVAISGSKALPEAATDDPAFVEARADLMESLDRAGARLGQFPPPGVEQPSVSGDDPAEEIERLRARQQTIVSVLDSLSAVPDESWRGAMPGLRASVSDLHARIDRVEIAAVDSADALDALFRSWLAEADRSLVQLEENTQDSVFNERAHELRALRRRCAAVSKRIDRLLSTDDDARLRGTVADELITMRRELRALERTTGRRVANRFP